MEEFFDFFEIDENGFKNNKYTIDLEDSDSFIEALSTVQENDWFEMDEDNVVYTEDENKITFYNKDYTVYFDGNFDNDTYYMFVTKKGK